MNYKIINLAFCTALCALAFSSCEKNNENSSSFHEGEVGMGREICFAAGMQGQTKAMTETKTARNFSVSAFYSENSAVKTFFLNKKTETSDAYEKVGGYFWPGWNLSFFAVLPNTSMSCTSGDVTIPVGTSSRKLAGTEDYICAKNEDVAKGTNPVTLKFQHILANIAGVKFSTSFEGEAVTFTVTSLSVSAPRYGTYSISKEKWSNLGQAESIALTKPAAMSGKDSKTASSDISLIPGTYTVSIAYKVDFNGTSSTFQKSATVTVPAGQKSTLVASFKDSDDLESIQFSVDIAPWTTNNVSLTLS